MMRLGTLVLLLVAAGTLSAQPPIAAAPTPASAEASLIARQHKELIPDLIQALQDTDSLVRQHAAMALAAVGPGAVKPLIEALRDPVNEKRAAAAYALGQMGYEGRDAMPPLQKALKDEEPSVRRAAAQAISRILSDEMGEPSYSSRYRGRNNRSLPRLTVPDNQTGPLPPLDPVPNTKPSKDEKGDKREPLK